MEQITLKVEKRETGKQISKKYRSENKVPGIFYFKGTEAIPILSDILALRPIVYTKETRVINLEIPGEEVRECVLKDVTFDPVTDKITHFDLIGLSRDTIMSFEVPVSLVGAAKGVREGGNLQQSIHKLNIKCLPKNLPGQLEVDITNLELGSSIYISSINIEGVEIDLPGDTPIVSCVHSRVSKSESVASEATQENAQAKE